MRSSMAVPLGAALVSMLCAVPGAAHGQTTLLTLEDAISTAMRNHPVISAAGHGIEAADALHDVATAGFMPTLDFGARYSRATGNLVPTPGALGLGTAGEAPTTSTRSYNFFLFGIDLHQPIWDFGRTSGALEAAEAGADAARMNMASTRLDVWFGVVRAYYGVLAAQQMLDVAAKTRDQMKAMATRAKEMYEAGARPRIDMVRAIAAQGAAEADLVGAREALSLARSELLRAMGVSKPFPLEVVRPEKGTAPDIPDVDEAFKRAIDSRPERGAMLAEIRAREAAVTAAIGGYFPVLEAFGGFSEAGVEIDDLVWNWEVGAALSFPILSVLRNRHSVRAARASLAEARAALQQLDITIRSEVEQARSRVVQAMARLGPVHDALAAARETMKLAEERYRVGEGDQIEYLNAYTGLVTAEADEIRAEYDLSMARAALERAMGLVPPGSPGNEGAAR